MVRVYNANYEYKSALKIMIPYVESHKDIYDLWLYGETLFKAKKYKQSQKIYQHTIQKFPNNILLQLDFANKLISFAKLHQAEKILVPLTKLKNDYQFVAIKKLAEVYYWQGKYDLSNQIIVKAIKLNSNDKEIDQLLKQVILAQKNWVGVDFSYLKDNQPVSNFKPKGVIGYYLNEKISFGVKINNSFLKSNSYDGNNTDINLYSILNLHKWGIKTFVEVGINDLPNRERSINGSFLFNKNLYRHLALELNASYKPYLLSIPSLSMNIMELKYGLSFVWDNPNGFIVRTGLNNNQFPVYRNSYYTGYIWGLSPKLKLSIFNFRIGYGFSYRDSEHSTYSTIDSLQTIIQNSWNNQTQKFTPLTNIPGFYDPFFSPSNQLANSVLVSVESKIINSLRLNLMGRFGIYSSVNIPSLNLVYEDGAVAPSIKTYYTNIQYFPFSIDANFSYEISSTINLGFYYKHESTIFYNSDLIGAKFKYLF